MTTGFTYTSWWLCWIAESSEDRKMFPVSVNISYQVYYYSFLTPKITEFIMEMQFANAIINWRKIIHKQCYCVQHRIKFWLFLKCKNDFTHRWTAYFSTRISVKWISARMCRGIFRRKVPGIKVPTFGLAVSLFIPTSPIGGWRRRFGKEWSLQNGYHEPKTFIVT